MGFFPSGIGGVVILLEGETMKIHHTGQEDALASLKRWGPSTLSELAGRMGKSTSVASDIIKRLRKKGLVAEVFKGVYRVS